MVHLGDVPPKFLALLSKAVSLFLLIVCFFVLQRIFDLDFLCVCRPGLYVNDFLFIFFPPLILTWLVIVTETFYQKSFCSCCNRCCSNFCSFIWNILFKYFYLLAVWASTVLLDGDWYFCLKTNLNSSQTGLPCRENLTYEEKLIKVQYKNESLDIGLIVIAVMFVVWNVYERLKLCIRRTRCKGCCECSWLCPPYYRAVYEDLLSEAVNSHLEEELKKLAEERAQQICKKHLEIIRNHEMSGQNQDDSNVTNNSGNPPANAGDANNSSNSNGNPDENPNGNGNADENPNGNGNADENPNGNGNADENPNGNGNPDENPNANGNPSENPNGNGNADENPNGNGNADENPNGNGNLDENPNANGNPSENPNGNGNADENPNGNADENPNGNGNGNADQNPNGNGNADQNPNGNGNADENGNGNPNENPNNNPLGNNEKGDIFDTWQKNSLSSFYLMNENE